MFVAAVATGATRSDTVLLATNVDPSKIAIDPWVLLLFPHATLTDNPYDETIVQLLHCHTGLYIEGPE